MSAIREIRLEDIPRVIAQLDDRVSKSGFAPDCLVYLERGARLIAAELQAQRGLGAIAIYVQRPGAGWKAMAVKVLVSLPDVVKTTLRRIESRVQVRRVPSKRTVQARAPVDLVGRRVLVLDDAVDSGASVNAAIEWIISMGARREDIRVAALTVTSPVAAHRVDFSLYSELCRFPWSSDSPEHPQFLERYERTEITQYPSGAI